MKQRLSFLTGIRYVVATPMAWMWHKTINLHDEGLGVTCRYTAPTVMSNRYFRCLQLLSAGFWNSSIEVIRGSIRGNVANLIDDTAHNEQETVLY